MSLRRPEKSTIWLLIGILAAGVIRLLTYLFFMEHVPMSGDEPFYWRGAEAFLSFVGLAESPPGGALNVIIGQGWFMPGMSLLLTPVRVLSDSVAIGRLFIGAVNFGLTVAAVLLIKKQFGKIAGWALLGIATLVPEVLVFSFTFWSEQTASWLALLLTLSLFSPTKTQSAHTRPLPWLAFGLGTAVLIYLRPSLILLAPALGAMILGRFLFASRPREAIVQSLKAWALIGVTIAVCLAPWTFALSTSMGGFFPTTTSLELGLIVGFADRSDIKDTIGREPGNLWHDLHNHITQLADSTNRTYGQTLDQERRRLLSGLTPNHYLQGVSDHTTDLLLPTVTFIDRFGSLVANEADTPDHADRVAGLTADIDLVSRAIWIGLAGLMAILMLVPFKPNVRALWLSLGFKTLVLILLVQPFVHGANPRHHSILIPWIAAAIAIVVQKPSNARPATYSLLRYGSPGERYGSLIQVVVSAVSLLVAVFLFLPWR